MHTNNARLYLDFHDFVSDPPTSPANMTGVSDGRNILVSVDNRIGPLAYTLLNTSHTLSIRGYECNNTRDAAWRTFRSCQPLTRNNRELVQCRVRLSENETMGECLKYGAVLEITNNFGRTKSREFTIQTGRSVNP